MSVGTKTRVPSPKIQRAVDVRDGRLCTFPACARPSEETHHVVHWVDGQHTAVEILTSLCAYHHRAHHRGMFDIGVNPADGLVRFTRPGGGVILGRAATGGAAANVLSEFPVAPGTLPTRWDGSPLRASELTPPLKERTQPTGLRFASPDPPEQTAARLAHTLRCRFEHEAEIWVTSDPDLITLTAERRAAWSPSSSPPTHSTSPPPSPPSASAWCRRQAAEATAPAATAEPEGASDGSAFGGRRLIAQRFRRKRLGTGWTQTLVPPTPQ